MHLDHKHCRVNENYSSINALCFRGDGGDPEVNGERETELFITRNGETEEVIMPVLADKWALKDKDMNVNDMLDVWAGKTNSLYGEQAILSTLCSYLVLLQNCDVAEALSQAKQLWLQRDKSALPF